MLKILLNLTNMALDCMQEWNVGHERHMQTGNGAMDQHQWVQVRAGAVEQRDHRPCGGGDEERRQERSVSGHHASDRAEEGRAPVEPPRAGHAVARGGGLQPLVPSRRAGHVERDPLRKPFVHEL